jgi:hypothetical protein
MGGLWPPFFVFWMAFASSDIAKRMPAGQDIE